MLVGYVNEPDLNPNVIEPLDFFGPNDVSEKLDLVVKAYAETDALDYDEADIEACVIDKTILPRLKEICQQIKECKRRVYKWKVGDPDFCSIQANQHSMFLAVTDLFGLADKNPLSPDDLLDFVIKNLEGSGSGIEIWNKDNLTYVNKLLADARDKMEKEND